MELVSEQHRHRVHRKQDYEQDDDSGRREVLELFLRAGNPVEYLYGHHRELVERRRGNEGDVNQRAYGDDRGSLANGPGEGEDRAGKDARNGGGEHRPLDYLPLVRAKRESSKPVFVRDSAYGFAGSEDHDGQHQQGERHRAGQNDPAQRHELHEQRPAEQSVHDGRHAGEVGYVDLDEPGEPVAGRVFFEVDGGPNSDRHRKDGGQTDCPYSAHHRGLDSGLLGMPGRITGDEIPVQPGPSGGDYLREQHYQADDAHHDRAQEHEIEDRAYGLASRERGVEVDVCSSCH